MPFRLLAAELARAISSRRIVVNNAGFGLVGEALRLDRDEQLAMIDLNVRALTELSLAFTDSLARRRGGILNVASLAAFLPGPGMAVYYASKAYVLSFSEALHHELAGLGVRVTALCPGPVATGFQARAGLQGDNLAHARAIRKAGGAHRLSRLHARRARGGRRHPQPDRGFAAAVHTPWAAAVGGRSARAERAPPVLGRPVSTALPPHSRAAGIELRASAVRAPDSCFCGASR